MPRTTTQNLEWRATLRTERAIRAGRDVDRVLADIRRSLIENGRTAQQTDAIVARVHRNATALYQRRAAAIATNTRLTKAQQAAEIQLSVAQSRARAQLQREERAVQAAKLATLRVTEAQARAEARAAAASQTGGLLGGARGILRSATAALAAVGAVTALGVAAFRTVQAFTQASDRLELLRGQIRLVTSNAGELEIRLTSLARRTRNAFASVVTVFTRTARSLQSIDPTITQAEILAFTETISQLVRISGSSAREASGALIQLSQGLASNRLGGEELRSVMEQIPAVAISIANGLGVGLGRLREMAREGRLGALPVITAIADQAELTAERFATLPVLTDQLEQRLRDSSTRLLETIGHATGLIEVYRTLVELLDNAAQIADRQITITFLETGVQAAIRRFDEALANRPALSEDAGRDERLRHLREEVALIEGLMREFKLESAEALDEAVEASRTRAQTLQDIIDDEDTDPFARARAQASLETRNAVLTNQLELQSRVNSVTERYDELISGIRDKNAEINKFIREQVVASADLTGDTEVQILAIRERARLANESRLQAIGATDEQLDAARQAVAVEPDIATRTRLQGNLERLERARNESDRRAAAEATAEINQILQRIEDERIRTINEYYRKLSDSYSQINRLELQRASFAGPVARATEQGRQELQAFDRETERLVAVARERGDRISDVEFDRAIERESLVTRHEENITETQREANEKREEEARRAGDALARIEERNRQRVLSVVRRYNELTISADSQTATAGLGRFDAERARLDADLQRRERELDQRVLDAVVDDLDARQVRDIRDAGEAALEAIRRRNAAVLEELRENLVERYRTAVQDVVKSTLSLFEGFEDNTRGWIRTLQRAIDLLQQIQRLRESRDDIGGGGLSGLGRIFSFLGGGAPSFHQGGVVPGRPGEEVLAVLEAQETVIPAGQRVGDTINVHVEPTFIVNPDDLVASSITRNAPEFGAMLAYELDRARGVRA